MKIAREPWNPWPSLSPLGMPAAMDRRPPSFPGGANEVERALPRYHVMCWSRAADGTIDRIELG